MMCTGCTLHLLPAFLLTDGHGLDGIDVNYVIYFREGNSVSVLVGGDALISTSGLDSHFLLLLGNGISAISIREVYWIA